MDEIDDVIGLLNSNRQQNKAKAQDMQTSDAGASKPSAEEEKEISDRKLNIEKLMEELEAMKAKK